MVVTYLYVGQPFGKEIMFQPKNAEDLFPHIVVCLGRVMISAKEEEYLHTMAQAAVDKARVFF